MNKITLPSSFIYGVADSDLQTIGEDLTRKYENSEQTMWDFFAKTSGKCFNNDTPGIGTDKYHKWPEDIEILKELGITNYRTSVSMARILNRNGNVNSEALKWYRNFFSKLKSEKINIFATLYHWELPQYLSENGGWKNKKTIEIYLKHCNAVVENLGDLIDEYFLLNEPWASGFVGHYYGVHAPGETNLKSALLSIHNLLLAQGLAFKELSNKYNAIKLSTVYNVAPAYPQSNKSEDILAAKYCDGFYNRWFLDPIYFGEYPLDMLELFEKDLPTISNEDLKIIKIGSELDSIGLNYYNGHIVKRSEKNLLGFEDIYDLSKNHNDLGWAIFTKPDYPEGLFDILSNLTKKYKFKKIYITENGTAFKSTWDGNQELVDDDRRIKFISDHLSQVKKALDDNIPVAGYFSWTFMDNYEWNEGYRPESAFGLIYVDRKTMERVIKKSALWYKNQIL